MKHIKTLIILFAFAFVLASCGTNSKQEDSKEIAEEQNEERFDNNSEMEDVSDFAVKAAEGGLLEVELAQLALTKGTSARVKEFAQSMITDHGKANEELKSLAQSKNITLPTTMSEDSREHYNKLSEKTGTDFDKAYSEFMVKDHKEDLNMFRKAAEKAEDPDLKSWASSKVPVLEHHLSMAESMEDNIASANANDDEGL